MSDGGYGRIVNAVYENEWSRQSNLRACPVCGAVVAVPDTVTHDEWHAALRPADD